MNMDIACDLSVFGSKDNAIQHEKNSGSVLKKCEGVEERPDGYAFRYPYSPEMFTTLSQWITMENKCCPFFTFALRLVPDGTRRTIWLEIGGSNEIKEFIAINFSSSFGVNLNQVKESKFIG